MAKPMKRRALVKILRRAGYTHKRDTGRHTIYQCPCGRHLAVVPRHDEISAGVVGNIASSGECMAKGWLQ